MAKMNMAKMMQEAKKMQAQMAQAQDEVALLEAQGTAGGGVVKVVATGDGRIKEVTIDPDAIDPEDVEMLQDLVLTATNEALNSVGDLAQMRMDAVTGGLNIPGF